MISHTFLVKLTKKTPLISFDIIEIKGYTTTVLMKGVYFED